VAALKQGRGADYCGPIKENPAGVGLAGKSGKAGREMALPAKHVGQQVLAGEILKIRAS
jgi:hypothetical protein